MNRVESSMSISIRPLVDADLETADAILNLAFQSSVSRLHDLRLYRQMQPDGWFVATQAEHLIGMVGAVNYGTFAHVGLMAVHPDVQRRGVGFALMQFLLAGLEKQHVPLVTLDASVAGRPLYEKLGFVPYDETLVFQRHHNALRLNRPAYVQSLSIRELDVLAQWDRGAFGANRCKVLRILLDAFPGRAFLQRDENGQIKGYLIAQKTRLGPWVMFQSGNAEELLQAALTLPYDESISVTVPSGNRQEIALLQRYDFEQVRANQHMGRGVGGSPGQREQIYSQTSLAAG
jgi:predicted N-acetyltransferase YhbS